MKTIDELLAELRKRDPAAMVVFGQASSHCNNSLHIVGCCVAIAIARGPATEIEIETCGVSCVDALTNAIDVINMRYPLEKSN